MHSTRFQRIVIVTNHAAQRMAERGISEEILLEVSTRETPVTRMTLTCRFLRLSLHESTISCAQFWFWKMR